MKKLFENIPLLIILSIPGFWYLLFKLFKWLDIFEGFVLHFQFSGWIPDNFFVIPLFLLSALIAIWLMIIAVFSLFNFFSNEKRQNIKNLRDLLKLLKGFDKN